MNDFYLGMFLGIVVGWVLASIFVLANKLISGPPQPMKEYPTISQEELPVPKKHRTMWDK